MKKTIIHRWARAGMAMAMAAVLMGDRPVQAMVLADVNASNADKLIEEKGLKPLKKAQRVFIPGYRIAFIVKNVASASGQDYLGGGSGAKAELTVNLENIDAATMQSIADQAYANFMAKLRDAGIEIVPLETMKASPAYQAMETTVTTSEKPYVKKNGWMSVVVMSPKDLPLWFTAGEKVGDKSPLSQANNKALLKMVKEFDAVGIYPIFYIDFAGLQSSGNSKFAKNAEVSAQSLLRVLGQVSGVAVADSGFGNWAKFKEGVRLNESAGEWIETAKSNNSGWISTFAHMGLDAGPVKGSKEMSLKADPAKYSSLCAQVLDGAADGIKFAIQDVRK